MRAVVYREYGSPDVLRLEEVDRPAPGPGEVLVRVRYAGVGAGDLRLLHGDPWLVRLMSGLSRPKFNVLGSDMSGTVEAAGEGASRFAPGDAVFGDLSASGFGGFAEYVRVPEKQLVAKPAALSFAEAAALPMSSVTALQALRDHGKIASGQQVLINGASGGVGSYALQLAKHFGAEVTGVASTAKLDRLRELGADHVVDYRREDFTQGEQRYDLIYAANGYHPIMAYRRVLKPHGRYVMSGGEMRQLTEAMLLGPLLSLGGQKLTSMFASPNAADLEFIAGLADAGSVRALVDASYPLEQAPDALRELEAGRVKGKLVIELAGEA